jgi:hypothetical protein
MIGFGTRLIVASRRTQAVSLVAWCSFPDTAPLRPSTLHTQAADLPRIRGRDRGL